MCFVPNDYLIIATTANNYYFKLDDNLLFNKTEMSQMTENIDVDMSSQQTIDYLTTLPESEKEKKFKAQVAFVENKSQNNSPFQDSFTVNKLVYCRNLLGKNENISKAS